MNSFSFQETKIDGLMLITPPIIRDERGHFSKTFEVELFSSNGINFSVMEELESSSSCNTLRGLHFQWKHSQDKLVRVLSGEVYDVAVDLRPDSKTFGEWESFYLSAENRNMLYIPKDFAHGFLAMQENTTLHYLCGDQYDPINEDGILWDDSELSIPWPLVYGKLPKMSHRDRTFQTFAQFRERRTFRG